MCLLESAYALERLLKKPREEVVDALVALLREPNIQVQGIDKGTVIQAFRYCRPSRRISFGDALLWAVAHQDSGEIYTFDARFLSAGVTLREP